MIKEFNFKNFYKHIDIKYIYLAITVLISVILGINNISYFWISIFALIGLPYLARFSLKGDYSTIIFLVFFITMQNIVLIIFSPFLNATTSNLIIVYKELLVICTIFCFIFLKRNINVLLENKIILVFCLYLLVSLIISSAGLKVKLVGVRQLVIPMLLYLFGRSVSIGDKKLKYVMKILIVISLIASIFGFVELFILGDKFWNTLGISKYMANKGFEKWMSGNGIPGNFYTYDFSEFTGKAARRIASIFADPLAYGHFILPSLMYLVYAEDVVKNRIIRYIYVVILGLGLILTLSKGSILIMVISVLFYLYFIKDKRILSYIILGITFIGVMAVIIYSSTRVNSVYHHMAGFISNFANISIFGKGIGTSGNFAILYSETGENILAGESFIGTLIGQLGIVGCILYILFNLKLIKELMQKRNRYDDKITLLISSLIIGVLFESFIAESSISFIGTGMYFMFAGIILNIIKKNEDFIDNNLV